MPLPDRLAVNGTVAWKAFAVAGYPVEHLAAEEGLRYLNLSGMAAKRRLDCTERCIEKPPRSESVRVNILILGDMDPKSMHHFLRLLEDTVKLLPSDYKFTFKPHPAYAVCLADYPGLQADETTKALDRILGEYDFALAANTTSASVDAFLAGLPVIIGLDGDALNLSPLRGQPDVHFVSTREEVAAALRIAGQGLGTSPNHNGFFFLDPELPRWKRLLELQD